MAKSNYRSADNTRKRVAKNRGKYKGSTKSKPKLTAQQVIQAKTQYTTKLNDSYKRLKQP